MPPGPVASPASSAPPPALRAGRLDQGLDEAKARGWTLVSMKGDWKVIFPFERK
jgi:hypothetical protein